MSEKEASPRGRSIKTRIETALMPDSDHVVKTCPRGRSIKTRIETADWGAMTTPPNRCPRGGSIKTRIETGVPAVDRVDELVSERRIH